MKVMKYTIYALVLADLASCGVSSDKNIKDTIIEQSYMADEEANDESA